MAFSFLVAGIGFVQAPTIQIYIWRRFLVIKASPPFFLFYSSSCELLGIAVHTRNSLKIGGFANRLLTTVFFHRQLFKRVILCLMFNSASELRRNLADVRLIKALDIAHAVVVAPVHYSIILWATFCGFMVFDQLPDMWTWVGASIIVVMEM